MGTRVLIIDDDHDILETTGSILATEGFQITCADSVEKGLELIDSVAPEVVLLDIVFPEEHAGGSKAAQEIKARHPGLPLIVFSVINREYILELTGAEIMADEFLVKPVRPEMLVQAIRRRVSWR